MNHTDNLDNENFPQILKESFLIMTSRYLQVVFRILSVPLVRINQTMRLLLFILWICCCPALVWAEDVFCGHECPKQLHQVCHCDDHQLCYSLATEKPGPKAPAPPRLEVLCPPALQVDFPVLDLMPAAARYRRPPSRPFCPSLAPEPPPPRV